MNNNHDDNNKGRVHFMCTEGHVFVMFIIDVLFYVGLFHFY